MIMTEDAEIDLNHFVSYLLFVKKSEQAAGNLLDDFEAARRNLTIVAASLRDCTNSKLKDQGYKRIRFISHRYFMLYRIEGDMVIVDNVFHELQDYENHLC